MKENFLKALEEELRKNNIDNIDDIVSKYAKRFDLGYEATMTDQEIIDSFDSIDEIVKAYQHQCNKEKNELSVDLDLSIFSNFEIELSSKLGINFEIDDDAKDLISITIKNSIIHLKTLNDYKPRRPKYEGKMLIGHDVLLNKLMLNGVSCDVNICDLSGKYLEINSISGDFNIKSLKANDVKLSSTSGDFSIDSITSQNLFISVVSGDYCIDEVTIDNCKINTISGDVEINYSNDAKYNISSVSGDVIIKKGVSIENVKSSSVSGDIIIANKNCNSSITSQISNVLSKIKW